MNHCAYDGACRGPARVADLCFSEGEGRSLRLIRVAIMRLNRT